MLYVHVLQTCYFSSTNMPVTDQLLIILSAFCLHTADSLVVTKHDPDTITNYFNHVRHIYSKEAVEEFLNVDPRQYCHELRKANIYESVPMAMKGEQPIPSLHFHHMPVNLFEIEKKQGEHQMRRIRFRNNNQTHKLHSFQCVSLHEKPEWFITPGFIPHSNFLFEVEPSFHQVVLRETNEKHDVIPTRLIAIIDKSAINQNRLSFNKNWNPVQRDPLCDLIPILRFRLCAIVNDAVENNQSASSSDADNTPFRTYIDRSTNFYYQPQKYEDMCETAPVEQVQSSRLAGKELLYCDIRYNYWKRSLYLASNIMSDPTNLLHITKVVISPSDKITELGCKIVPLLEHLKLYIRALS